MEACALFPIVNGKPSSLWKELYTRTGKDRKLTNLLYALTLQPEIKGIFTHSDLNSQGEPTFNVVKDKLGLEDILNLKLTIIAEAKAINALDNRGNIVYYDTAEELLLTMYDFNDSHDKLKATIEHSEGGFYFNVDVINSENYNTNNSYRIREALFNSLSNHLQSKGFNTLFSLDTLAAFNTKNVYYLLQKIGEFRNGLNKINLDTANLIIDLFAEEPFILRLRTTFGDDLALAISQVSGYYYSSALSINDYNTLLITLFLNKAKTKLRKDIKLSELDLLKAEAIQDTNIEETYMGTSGLSIKETLNDLYRDFHIDLDTLDVLSTRVDSISTAANKLFLIRLKKYQEARLKKTADKSEEVRLKRIQRDLENAKYLDSISKMLEDLRSLIKINNRSILLKARDLLRNPDSLKAINSYASLVTKMLDLVDCYSGVMLSLENADLLLNDDDTGSATVVDSIRLIAGEFRSTLGRMEDQAREKQIDIVKAFLKIYWGEDNVEEAKRRGSDRTLEGIMNMATLDINFFDRFIWAANQSSDEMMNLIAEATKQARYRRDLRLEEEYRQVRIADSKVGEDTKFMFVLDKEGYPSKIISNYNYVKYEEDLEAYKKQIRDDKEISSKDYADLELKWINDRTKTVTEFGIKLSVPYYEENGRNIYAESTTVELRLTPAQYAYYQTMMLLKAGMLGKIQEANNNDLYNVIEIGKDLTTAVAESGDFSAVAKAIKNKVLDLFTQREDSTEYGSIYEENGIALTHVNAKGEPILTLPLYYNRKIKDRSRVSTDFSKAMLAYLASSELFIEMNKILDTLMLTKDYMLNVRRSQETAGESVMADVSRLGHKAYVNVASKLGAETGLKGLADDFYERVVFGKARKNEGYLWGTKIKVDTAVNALVGYTSVTGLAVNVLGAEANLLVGKIQMLIESGLGMEGEFFGMKDLLYADAKYFLMLPELLNEVASNNKSSELGLLMLRFDVLDDFYEKIKETGFYKSPLSKIIGNTNLFFLYGIGEHLLHAQGMIAILHNKLNKVLDANGNELLLIEAFEVEKDETGNGRLKIKEGWTLKDGSAIDDAFLNKIKGKIAYTNKSMHGAFGSADKGMLHRYAVGRMIMNFRQWMPAHYGRRFRGLHYDTDLGLYREGYYVTSFKFLRDLGKDLINAKFQIATRWDELNDMEKYNLKRAIAESAILIMLAASLALIGDADDHKGNWAYRHLIYELKRMQMEETASHPLGGYGYGFIKDGIKILNSPFACLDTAGKLARLLDITDAFETIESGKHKGENRYMYNMERALPFYGQIVKTTELGESDDLFKLFNY